MQLPDVPVFVTRCPLCGEVLDVDSESGTWRQAVCWGYLADLAHRRACPNQPKGDPP